MEQDVLHYDSCAAGGRYLLGVLLENGGIINQIGVATCFPVSWSKSFVVVLTNLPSRHGHDIVEYQAELHLRDLYSYKSFAVVFECSLMIAWNTIVIPKNNFRTE